MEYTFTLEELNHMLGELGEIKAKYSLNLINFIQHKVNTQDKQQKESKPQKEEQR